MSFGLSALIRSFNSARALHHLSGVINTMPAYLREDVGLRLADRAGVLSTGVNASRLATTAHRQMGLI
jgi:hypothetical protein